MDEATHRLYTLRYIGSLVSDFHRNLLKGSIYLYPSTAIHPNGKLRLAYECNSIAFLAAQAGWQGPATAKTAYQLVDIEPHKLHKRSAFFTDTQSMVDDVERFIRDGRASRDVAQCYSASAPRAGRSPRWPAQQHQPTRGRPAYRGRKSVILAVSPFLESLRKTT